VKVHITAPLTAVRAYHEPEAHIWRGTAGPNLGRSQTLNNKRKPGSPSSATTRYEAAPVGQLDFVPSLSDYRQRVEGLVVEGQADSGEPLRLPALSLDQGTYRRLSATEGAWFDPTGVVSVISNSAYEPFGRLLASCTGREVREHRSVVDAIQDSRSTTTTVVVAPDEATQANLAALPAGSPVSILTARTPVAMSDLVIRTLTTPVRDTLRTLEVQWYGNDTPGSGATADKVWGTAATVDEVRRRTRERQDLLSLVTVGRSCSLYLADGMVCGQNKDGSGWTVEAAAPQPTSCQLGEGCYRFGWGPERMLFGHELDAGVVLVNACRSLQLSDGELTPNVSLALSILDGSAIAFVGSAYKSRRVHYLPTLFAYLLSKGMPLGKAVAYLNQTTESDPDAYCRLGLIGDAGLIMTDGSDIREPPRAGMVDEIAGWLPSSLAERMHEQADTQPVAPTGTPAHDRHHQNVRNYLRSALLINYPPDAPALKLLHSVRNPGADSTSAADDRFNAAQGHFIERLIETAGVEYLHFDSMIPRDGIIHSDKSAECLNCERKSITYRITYPDIQEHLVVQLCPRCSPFLEGYPLDEFEVQLHGCESIRAGEEFTIDLVLANTGNRPINVAVGGALRFGFFYQARFGSTKTRTVRAGDSFTHTFTGMIPSGAPPNDLHAFQIFCLVDGRISMLSKPLWRTTPELETTS
jgi:hypothetical protein